MKTPPDNRRCFYFFLWLKVKTECNDSGVVYIDGIFGYRSGLRDSDQSSLSTAVSVEWQGEQGYG